MACKHCEHDHCEEIKEKESKLSIYLYGLSILTVFLSFIPIFANYQIVFIFMTILFSGYELLISGIKNLFHFHFKEDTLMTIAVIAAFVLGEYVESAFVVILYRLGEFLEDRAVNKSEENIKEIVKIQADLANLVVDNTIETVLVEKVQVDDTILIKPGEKVPVDCQVIYGDSEIDTSAITGESSPVYVTKNQEVLSGGVNLTGAITCRVLRDVKHSTASQIVDLVYQASNNKGKTEKFITKFSKIYTPTVIIIALLIAILPASFGYLDYHTWIIRALIFLVASCPCSLVISVPLSFFSAVGKISKKGMVVKGTKHIENLSKATVVAFDKTGTLTTGNMKIESIKVLGDYSEETILNHIYSLELLSNHPIGTAIKHYRQEERKEEKVENYKEIAGHGLYGKIGDQEILFGNIKLMKRYGVQINVQENLQEAIYLSIDQQIAAYITITEDIRKEGLEIVKNLKKNGIEKVIMLTGDNEKNAEKIAGILNIDEVKAGLLPTDKLHVIEEIKKQGKKVIFIGDGINDGPVLATSDFGIAMGAGSNIAGITADGILISNHIGKIPEMIKTSKRAMKVVKFNIVFSLAIKAMILLLGAIGVAPIWSAILADTGVTFLTVVNAIKNIK